MIYPQTMAVEWQKYEGFGLLVMEWGYPYFSQRRWGVFKNGSSLFYVLAQAQKIMINRWMRACKDHLLEKLFTSWLWSNGSGPRKTPKTIGNTQILLLIIIFPIKINMNWRSLTPHFLTNAYAANM